MRIIDKSDGKEEGSKFKKMGYNKISVVAIPTMHAWY
jgi:hypothetical protein